jgi:hypothetical protein
MSYYESKTSKVPKGVIPLNEVKVTQQDGNILDVAIPSRSYTIRVVDSGDRDADAKRWLELLSAVSIKCAAPVVSQDKAEAVAGTHSKSLSQKNMLPASTPFEFAGWVLKRGAAENSSYKKRYFTLRERTLSYYKVDTHPPIARTGGCKV